MINQASFTLRNRNPDVLTCIANLSNDEVFTPPEFASRMLDTLAEVWAADNGGANLWADSSVKFLDPCTKSGVFLREITTRLTRDLAEEIPDLDERVDHILTKQVFGIAITQITSLLARRSVYCSKHANGEHSIANSFDDDAGNVWFERMEHTWEGNKCKYCGAPKAILDRDSELENYAYAFIHTHDIKARMVELFGGDMQFDVIIGNPPYQMSDGGFGISAQPIYHHFIEQAKRLEPRYLTMVTPARWFSGGKGLNAFRKGMLSDGRIRAMVDYPNSNDVFSGTQIKGGVSFWLWDKDNPGDVEVSTYDKGELVSRVTRPLREPGADVFIRYNIGVSVLRKVLSVEENVSPENVVFSLNVDKQFKRLVSSRRPFGFNTTIMGHSQKKPGDVLLHRNGGVGYIGRDEITSSQAVVDQWKVLIPRAGSGSDAFPHPILSKPFIGQPGEVSSETYIYIGPFASRKETFNVITYLQTRLLRFLVLLHKPSQSTTREQYTFVPTQDFSKQWTDEMLYEKYGITEDEIEFINSMIRPMEIQGSLLDD